jgi:predicted AlkP superfamily phosphohydrolase/phosphomutase
MFNILKKKKDRRVVVVGIDGAPHSLLKDYMERGLMPGFRSLAGRGSFLRMKSTLPEISSVAWASFMTGKNPGAHGIFGFMEIDKNTYEYQFPNFSSLKARPFWDREGLKPVVFNIPQTYPAAPLDGVMVSGFVAVDLKKAVYPARVYDYLAGMGYRLDVNARLAADDPEAFFADLNQTFDKRTEAIRHLYDAEDWNLFICAITETDRLHHFFFDSAREGRYYGRFEDFYRKLDTFLSEMAGKAGKDGAMFLTCSDHGFTTIKSEVYLNRWLVENGFLKLSGGEGLTGIAGGSRAFCLDPSRIYIHLEGKYKRGSVKAADYEDVVSELVERLEGPDFQGEKVIKRIYTKKEIFEGDFAEKGPEIYLLPEYGFDLKGVAGTQKLFGTSRLLGMHTYDDAHLYVSLPFEKADVKMEDVAGIIAERL